jgi:hypothetical protein
VSTPLADGPAMYFGGTIMTFALPLGAFIVISLVLFYLFRSAHSGPRLRYPTVASFASLGTREPGPVPAPPVSASQVDTTAAEAESVVISEVVTAPAATAVPQATPLPEAEAEPETTAGPDTTEGKGGG